MTISEEIKNDLIKMLLFFKSRNNKSKKHIQHRYIVYGAYSEYLVSINNIIKNPNNAAKLIAKILFSRSRPSIIKLPFLCSYMRIGNNIRIFGYDSKFNQTIKIVLNQGRLFREVRARKLISAKSGLKCLIPYIIDYDRVGGKWIIEEMVGKSLKNHIYSLIRPSIKVKEFLIYYALPLYKATTRFKPLTEYMQKDFFKSIDGPLTELIFTYKDFRNEFLWPVALCHGDLVPGNMMIGENDQLYLFDWEFASHKPVAFDVSKIYIRYPKLRSLILILLHEISTESKCSKPVLCPRLQLSIALAHRNTALADNNQQIDFNKKLIDELIKGYHSSESGE